MAITMQFLYVLPMVVAVTLAGALGGRNVRGRARSLLWTGIALVVVAQLSSLLLPYIATRFRPGWALSAYSLGTSVISVTGIVLLIVAVGQAARAAGPQEPPPHPGSPGYRYPAAAAQPGYPQSATGYPQTQQYPAPQPEQRPGTPPYGGSPWGASGH